jgi:hypothetical protein
VVVAGGFFWFIIVRKSEYGYVSDDVDMLNGNGTLHGGCIAWLIDM